MAKNKHGLSRHIPAAVKALIRKNSGYGCVICGNAFVEYEHVEPEFNECKNHEAGNMTLLCPFHHSKKTRGTLSVDAVKKAMKSPWAFQHGLSHDDLELPAGPSEIYIGSSVYRDVRAVVSVNDQPIIWFKAPESKGGPARLNCIFCNDKGELIAKIEDNEYKSFRTACDVTMVGTTITVRDLEAKTNMLVIERVGGEAIRIHEMQMMYEGCNFTVKDGVMTATIGTSVTKISGSTIQGGNAFSFKIKGFHTDPGYYEAKDWMTRSSVVSPIGDTSLFVHSMDGIQYFTKRLSPARIVEVDDSTKLEEYYLSAEVVEVTIFLCGTKKSGFVFYNKLLQECNSVTVSHEDPITFIVLSIEDGVEKHGFILGNQPSPSEYTIETKHPRHLELYQNVKLIE